MSQAIRFHTDGSVELSWLRLWILSFLLLPRTTIMLQDGRFWPRARLTLSTELQLMLTVVRSVVLNGCSVWSMNLYDVVTVEILVHENV